MPKPGHLGPSKLCLDHTRKAGRTAELGAEAETGLAQAVLEREVVPVQVAAAAVEAVADLVVDLVDNSEAEHTAVVREVWQLPLSAVRHRHVAEHEAQVSVLAEVRTAQVQELGVHTAGVDLTAADPVEEGRMVVRRIDQDVAQVDLAVLG